LGRYDDSSDDERGAVSRGRGRERSPSPRDRSRYPLPPDPPVSHLRERDEYPPPRSRTSTTYKTLCVSSIHPKASDEVVKDSLYREFKKYGEVSIKLVLGAEPEDRLAYVSFRNPEDAKEARHSKQRIILYDKPAIVEPVYESQGRSRPRSRSPYSPGMPHGGSYRDEERYIRPRSPDDRHRPLYDDRYDYSLRGYGPPPPGHAGLYRDYRPPPYDYPPRGPAYHAPSRSHSAYYGAHPAPYEVGGRERGERGNERGGRNHDRYENKKDRFPNYLHHIPPEDDPLATRTLFAGNLEINITEEELRRIFGHYGVVEDVDIKRPPPGTGNAYAFVRFENLDQANRCKVELSGQYIGKFQVKIGYGKATPTTRIWVGGLGPWTSLAQLEREFDRFGAIKKIEYNKGDSHAYILYETIEAAQAAVQDMRGFCLGGPDRRLKTDFVDTNPPSAASTASSAKNKGGHYDSSGGSTSRADDMPYDSAWNGEGGDSYRKGHSNSGGRGRSGYDKRPGRGSTTGAADGEDWPAGSSRRPPHEDSDVGRGGDRSPSADRRSDDGRMHLLAGFRTLTEISRRCPSNWTGALVLKNSFFPAKLHLTSGESSIADLLLRDETGRPHLRITQRLRLDPPKLEDVSRRVSASASHAIYLAMPTSSVTPAEESSSSAVQSRPLRNLVTYLKQKEAAGVISLSNKEADITGVLYAFPPCSFAAEMLRRTAPSLTDESLKEDHLVVVVVKGGSA